MKKWKPGQLITINGIVYRVKKLLDRNYRHPYFLSCYKCEFGEKLSAVHNCSYCIRGYHKELPYNCYLKVFSKSSLKTGCKL